LLVKITFFFSLIFLIYLFFVRFYYSSSSNYFRLNHKTKLLKEKNIWDSELYIPAILGFSLFIEIILIVCSAFYLIFLR